uniref:Disease resistance protein winged helix domain-containing protein n=1 Tax=Davidia involucrata TaxID=16924 RepID=A0A5B6YIN8_DAVIN
MKLKQQISSRNKDESDDVNAHRYARTNGSANFRGGNSHKLLNGMPKLYRNPTFEQSLAYKDFQVRYDDLSRALKLCLLCFSVFPENVTIKKRLMIYWWIGEGFVSEELANEFFNELTVKGFIEPVYEKRCLVADSCKMHPFVRCAIIMLAERTKFFDFDTNEGNLTEDFSRSLRACLMGKGLAHIEDLEKLHTVFNVNEPILEFKPEKCECSVFGKVADLGHTSH